MIEWAAFFMLVILVKIVKESSNTLEGRLALAFNLNGELDLCLADATQVLDAVQLGDQTDATACNDGLAEAHFIHAVVYQHLDVIDFDNLVPHIRQQRECQIAVCDG